MNADQCNSFTYVTYLKKKHKDSRISNVGHLCYSISTIHKENEIFIRLNHEKF